MENLDKNQFIVTLDTLLNRRLSDAECTAFHAAYEEFIDLLHGLAVQSSKSPLDLLHELARLQSRLMRLQERIVGKESPQASLLESALLLTNFEIRLIFTRLRYPSIADQVSVEVPRSPLFLSGQFTPTDIMELATALHLSGAIRRIDGTRVDLTTLVDVLSRTFNVRINNPEQCRHAVVNRKLRLTRFLDFLRNSLVEYSQH
ncbi:MULTISPECIES: RteC domain-containing protein [Alistipes]|uniref:RteC domain-containing protein n=2 Tax=Rikenellaceae TaxID=171550 RepID=UPI0014599DCA|nr:MULTISPECIES: RteC domain-containing protein [Alistipes]MCI7592666.1 RteC domain-containing protein [Alistipes shahii]MDD7037906.1 RteC domain-containing protein [Alistipes senegalensis]NMF24636.1 RteC protein [Alistipes shahii]